MHRNSVICAGLLAGSMLWATGSQATTLYLGVQPGSAGAITTLATDLATPGTASYTADGTFSGLTVSSFSASEVVPPPDVNSNTIDVTAALSSNSANLFVSEIGQTATSFPSFASLFAVTGFNLAAAGGTALSVTESTYATPCAAATCVASDAYATGQLLSSQTFTSTGSVTDFAAVNPDLTTGQYVVTLDYHIVWQTFTGADHGNITASIDLSQTPLPATLPLFAGGLGFVGFLAKRRKQNAKQAIAAA
jgi:hypothetical protein